MVAAMDAVDVDGAILVSPWTLYRYDASYAVAVHASYPGRFGMVTPVDPSEPAIEDLIADWATQPGAIGIRLMLASSPAMEEGDPGLNRVIAAAARHDLPVNLFCWGRLELARQLAARSPGTRIVIDHLGLRQPFVPPVPAEPFAELTKVLALAKYPNVAIKISGACTLSHRSFPFTDLWPPLARIFEAFGIERCMWGTD
jgi:predicted TIM-barrel fold metal-dependent hydrolase